MVKKYQEINLKMAGKTAEIAGISLNGSSEAQLLKEITARVNQRKKTLVVTPNPEFIVYAQKNLWFKKIINKAHFAIPDGIGLIWASKLLRQSIGERVSGVDLMEKFCQEAAKRKWSVYFFGGRPGVAKKTLSVLKTRYSGLKGWAEDGPRFELKKWDAIAAKKWISEINRKKPTLLFVALGMGKQEKFIWENWNKLDVKLAMGVGGAFNYLSGEISRAPRWAQKLGLEWLYRLFRQPWRWRRQLALIEFAWLVLRQKARK